MFEVMQFAKVVRASYLTVYRSVADTYAYAYAYDYEMRESANQERFNPKCVARFQIATITCTVS